MKLVVRQMKKELIRAPSSHPVFKHQTSGSRGGGLHAALPTNSCGQTCFTGTKATSFGSAVLLCREERRLKLVFVLLQAPKRPDKHVFHSGSRESGSSSDPSLLLSSELLFTRA